VSQSTTPHSNDRAVLIQSEGELCEFADLFSELAMPVQECAEGFPKPTELEGARFVVVSGKRLLESDTPNLREWPRTIAVVDGWSKTLVNHLNRIGVAMVIRRPIHPRALRLLLLHEIYRGPERRGRKRVLIGHPIRVSSGLFKTSALLLELTPTSARLEVTNAPKVGSKLRILLGKDLTNAKTLKLQAKVVRRIRSSGAQSRGQSEIAVEILDAERHAKSITGLLENFALGPAKWKANQPLRQSRSDMPAEATVETKASETLVPPPTQTPISSVSSQDVEPEIADTVIDDAVIDDPGTDEGPDDLIDLPPPEVEIPATPSAVLDELELDPPENETPTAPPESPDDSAERRSQLRVPYDERVVALSEEAARVLVGRDLSAGGMRVAATPSIAIGDVLRIALHSGANTEPFVVLAHAFRDDGDDGFVLAFGKLSPTQREQFEKILSGGLPACSLEDEMEDAGATTGESIIVGEMLETIKVESDTEIAELLDSLFKIDE
jgi:hypothetical protein